MIQLVEAHYFENRDRATSAQVKFWLRELRTPELLVEVAQRNLPLCRRLAPTRSLLAHAAMGETGMVEHALQTEETATRELDRCDWLPLREELQKLRRPDDFIEGLRKRTGGQVHGVFTNFMAMKTSAFFLLFVAAFPLMAQQPPAGPGANRPGPWDHDVLVYRLTNEGRAAKLATFERAGVPTLARLKDGRIISAFQHFPKDDDRNFDRVAVRFSGDDGRTWTAASPITMDGMEAGLARPFDPTLVALPDGRVRLYFTSNRSPDFRRSTPAIYSAISTNGIHYGFESGVRFAVEGRIVIDCAAFLHGGMVHLIVPDNGTAEEFFGGMQRHEPPRGGTGYHATSTDGLKFTRVEDVKIPGNHRWLGNAVSDGKLITFFGSVTHVPGNSNQHRGGVWSGTSKDGNTWQLSRILDLEGADPGVVAARDGGWIVAVTGPPRPGTPTARQRSPSSR
jgi:hypothetical protein